MSIQNEQHSSDDVQIGLQSFVCIEKSVLQKMKAFQKKTLFKTI